VQGEPVAEDRVHVLRVDANNRMIKQAAVDIKAAPNFDTVPVC
jgi:hypothetical protein